MLREHLEQRRRVFGCVVCADDLDDQHRAKPLSRYAAAAENRGIARAGRGKRGGPAIPSEELGPLALLQRSSDAKALAACLARLEGKMRQAIMLAYFEGLSHSELAAHMQQPLGTVKTWIRRGLERLKSCLGENQ